MADDKHVTLTLEEADELAELMAKLGAEAARRFPFTASKALRLGAAIRARWLDALRKESA